MVKDERRGKREKSREGERGKNVMDGTRGKKRRVEGCKGRKG